MTTARYISSTETARMIRETLKIEFPGVKFRVAKTRGGSVRIQWMDGPSYEMVKSVAGFYEGSRFDPMIDLKSPKSHQDEGGERIHYLIDYALCEREYSIELLEQVVAWATPRYAWDSDPNLHVVDDGNGCGVIAAHNPFARFGNEWAADFLRRQLWNKSAEQIREMMAGA